MSETDITVSADVWPRALLEELVGNKLAGVAFDANGQRCAYCDWASESYSVDPQHEPGCPIRLGRAALAGAREQDTG